MSIRHSAITLILILFFSVFLNKSYGQIRPEAMRQIELLLQEKNARTPAQQKINSHLLQAVREHRGQLMCKGVNLKRANVHADAGGNLKVDIGAKISDQLLVKIEALGGKILYTSWKHNILRVLINLSAIETIAGYPEVYSVKPAVPVKIVGSGLSSSEFKQHTIDIESRLLSNKFIYGTPMVPAPLTGTITSQGDRTHRADDARNAYGYTGQGVRIGVLSDSYNALHGVASDIASGNLPGPGNPLGNTIPVTVLSDDSTGTDEGRAMLQIIHDIAPKAQLFFADAGINDSTYADNIIALRNPPYNCDIILDDAAYFDEATFQDGIVAQAVDSVTNNGALYFSAAGNEGSVAKNSSGYFEGDFNSTGSPRINPGERGTAHNFGTVAAPLIGDVIKSNGELHSLTWADPYGKSSNDYDLFLVSAGDSIKDASTDFQNGTQDPIEIIDTQTLVTGDFLLVFKTSTAKTRAFALNTNRGTLADTTTGQTHGHSAAVNAFSVAATPAVSPGPYPNPFAATNKVEYFSSDGPRRIFYNANGTAITANNFLFSTNGGTVRKKPDITAADGVSTTMPSASGLNPFYGTSAATPHAAAIAALLKSAKPSLTPAQIRTIITSTALDIEGAGYDINSGYGIVQAYQAMQLLNPAPVANIVLDTVKATEGSFSNHNGNIDPGETGNLTIQLSNAAVLTATNVSGILTTNTSGVIITQDSAFYGSIAANSYVGNVSMPYKFGVNATIPCGTVITFTLTVTYSGGLTPTQTFLIYDTLGGQPGSTITAVLGNTPPLSAGFTSTNGQQTGRLSRGPDPATCAAPLTNPGLLLTTGARQYDAYTFINTGTASQCVNVTMTSSNGANLYTATYNDSGFVPANPSTHFLADPGQSVISQQYSFTAPPAKAFTVVVHDVNVVPASSSAYTLDVSLSICSAAPPCTPDTIIAPVLLDSIGIPYVQSFSATGGSGAYLFSYTTDSLPTGLTLSGNTLSGTPAQAGIYPITVTTTDATGCPPATQIDTLVISKAVTYVFTGNGNWDIVGNWIRNNIPPATIAAGDQIIIDPVTGGQCILNIPYTLAPGATITVEQNKNFVLLGDLKLTQ